MEFTSIPGSSPRVAAIVGDKLSIIGKPVGNMPTLAFNVITQPSGSNIFSGLGSSGSNVTFAELDSATFAQTGYYKFTATAGDSAPFPFEVICWPANALTVDQVKYASSADRAGGVAQRSDLEKRLVLRGLAVHATKAGAQAALEGGAATAPWYGVRPQTLGAGQDNNLAPFAGWS